MSWPGFLWWIAMGTVCWTIWWNRRIESSTTSQSTNTHIFKLLINNIAVLRCYNTFLLPPDRFSGITAAMLRPITTTLRDVQAKIRTLLPQDAVLVGHSINNDLLSLKVSDYILALACSSDDMIVTSLGFECELLLTQNREESTEHWKHVLTCIVFCLPCSWSIRM